jgi:hypothetical protein
LGWGEQQIPYGNDRKKYNYKGKSKNSSGSFAALRMTSFVVIGG